MKKLFLIMAMILLSVGIAFGKAVKVEYTLSDDPTDRTVVLVTETSGDYSAMYGQVSEPNVDFVKIGNIKVGTPYFFVAYRFAANGETSIYSEEFPFTIPEGLPEVYDLPELETPQGVISISIEITPGI